MKEEIQVLKVNKEMLEEQIADYKKDINEIKKNYKIIEGKLKEHELESHNQTYSNALNMEMIKTELDKTKAELAKAKQPDKNSTEINSIINDITTKYNKTLSIIFKEKEEIFGKLISQIIFPMMTEDSIFEWLRTCKVFIEVLTEEAENIVEAVKSKTIAISHANEEIKRLKNTNVEMENELSNALIE